MSLSNPEGVNIQMTLLDVSHWLLYRVKPSIMLRLMLKSDMLSIHQLRYFDTHFIFMFGRRGHVDAGLKCLPACQESSLFLTA